MPKRSSNLIGIRKFITKVQKFRATLEQQIETEIRYEESEIIKMVQGQLAKGFDGNDEQVYLRRPFPFGDKLTFYAPATKRKKDIFGVGLGSITDVVTNYMSGSFYNSLYVNVLPKGGFEVKSSSVLWDIIEIRSGKDIINLSPSSERFLFENKIAPDLQQVIYDLYEV